MALTKVNRGGLNTGISDSSNATFLTVDSSEQAVIKSEGGAVTTSVQQGLAKSWVNFNGSSFGTRDSYNIGSVTDVSAGTYVPNFTSDMSNANYTITLVCGDNMHNTTLHNTLVATGSYRIHNLNDGGSFADTSIIMTNVHGDLA